MGTRRTLNLVYAEDQMGIRTSVCEYLQERGDIKVVFDTDNGNDLLAYLRRSAPLPDICVLDISMPLMDGLTLLERIREIFVDLPCLIYSMHENRNTIVKALQIGANAYLTKNAIYVELYQAIWSVAENGVAYSDIADRETIEEVKNGRIKVVKLTDREKQFIKYAGSDMPWQGIADSMGISLNTVMTYRSRCFEKLEVNTRVGLAMEAIRLGIINI